LFGHFFHLPLSPALSSSTPSLSGRTSSALFSSFVEEKTYAIIRKTKRFF
jgi:hypothetical protein